MIIKLYHAVNMLVADMTTQYLTFTNNVLHLCENVGCFEKQQIQKTIVTL